MSLRRKTTIAMVITLIGLLALLFIVLRYILLDSYTMLEQQVTTRNVVRVVNSFQDNASSLQRTMRDWSSWDETYQFAQDSNQDYIFNNLDDSTFWTLDINLMMFISPSDEIIYAKTLDTDRDWNGDLLASMKNYIIAEPRFLSRMTNVMTSGFIVVEGLPMMVASRPILRNDDSGPTAGTLIWGKIIGLNEIATLSDNLRLSIDLRGDRGTGLPEDFTAARSQLSTTVSETVIPMNQNFVAGYGLLDDIYGQPRLIARVVQDRAVYQQGQASLTYFAAALLVGGLVSIVLVMYLLERLVLARLDDLNRRVQQIGINDDFSMRLPITGGDELSRLAATINMTLNALTQSRNFLYESNSKLELRVGERTAELEQQRSQSQAIMETMGEGLVYCVDGTIAYVNRALVELLGYPAKELVGKPYALLNPQFDPGRASSLNKPVQNYQTTFTRSSGAVLNVAITSTEIKDMGDRQRLVVIVRDITQELAAKAQKDRFFARASHDLRSPLTSMMTRLYLLGKRPEQLDNHLRALNNVTNIMLELVNDLLDVSRLEQGEVSLKCRDLVLQTIVEEVVDVQQSDAELKRVGLCVEMSEQPLRVYGDPLRLNQVITNLISNAIHYTNEGGQIKVSLSADDDPDCACATIRVVDTGIGIAPEHIGHVFDAFFRVSEAEGTGTGLGLYIVKEIVDLHGGKISVSSEPGKGTTFTVRLYLTNERLAEV